jgi:ATP-binding cassette, subfamily B, multidrug efflux pump
VRGLRVFRRIGGYYRLHWVASAVGTVCVVASALIGLIVPGIVRVAVDALAGGGPIREVIRLAMLVPAVALIAGVLLFAQRRLLVGVSRHIEHHLRVELYEHILRLPPAFFLRQRIGDLLTRATSDVAAVRTAVGPAFMYSVNTVTVLIGAAILMARIDVELTLLALAVLPLVACVTLFFGRRIHARWGLEQEALSSYTARLQEHLVGMRVLRAYTCEDSEASALHARNESYVSAARRLIRLQAVFQPLLQGVVGISFVLVLAVGGAAVRAHTMTLGQFVEFNLYTMRLIWPMIAVGFVVNLVQRGAASMARIEELLREPPLPELVAAEPDGSYAGASSLELRNARFTYPGSSDAAVAGVNLSVMPGERVALVGGVGSGKTTLLSLIPRLLEPEIGSVLVDGADVRAMPLSRLRREVALVPQGSFLFSATLRENIALARPDASNDEIRQAAIAAGLEADLVTFPDGLDTLVGERGVTLSGGQRQRVALARAIAARPRVLLLDDCLSAVDTRTERIILDHLPDTTLILATHRLAAAELCDTVLVLEGGEVIERGSPSSLAAAHGRYANLLALQKLDQQSWQESA